MLSGCPEREIYFDFNAWSISWYLSSCNMCVVVLEVSSIHRVNRYPYGMSMGKEEIDVYKNFPVEVGQRLCGDIYKLLLSCCLVGCVHALSKPRYPPKQCRRKKDFQKVDPMAANDPGSRRGYPRTSRRKHNQEAPQRPVQCKH